MVAELQQAASDHPAIFSLFSVGLAYEGRTVWAGKISDNVGTDEDEPEVLFVGQHHAREHITVEKALYTLHLLADNYGTDRQITDLVNSREIYIVFTTIRTAANSTSPPARIARGARTASRTTDRLTSAPI